MRPTLALGLMAGLSCSLSSLAAPPAAPQEPEKRYDAHRMIKVHVSTLRELNTVLALTDDVRNCGGVGLGSFAVRVSPEQYAQMVAHGI